MTRDPAQISKLVSEGCIEDIIALMKSFPFNTKIQSDGLKSLAQLCTQAEGLTRLYACGGADVCGEAIRNNLDDAVMVADALMLLGALCTLDEQTAMKIYQSINPLEVLLSCTLFCLVWFGSLHIPTDRTNQPTTTTNVRHY